MSSTDGIDRVRNALKESASRHGIGDIPIIVGYSGGVDSAVLLHLLSVYRRSQKFSVIASYFDHGIRPSEERTREREVVTQFAESLSVELVTDSVQEGEIERASESSGLGIEAEARNRRHRFWAKLAEEYPGATVALAHHLDDQAETVVMRLIQGAGVRGLRGIQELTTILPVGGSGFRVWRPLLSLSKYDLVSYASAHDIPYVEDSTNDALDPLRNRVRHWVMPALAAVRHEAFTNIAVSARKLGDIDRVVDALARERATWSETSSGLRMNREQFEGCSRELRQRLLYHGVVQLGLSPEQIPTRFFRPILTAYRMRRSNELVSGYGVRVGCDDESLFMAWNVVAGRKNGYCIRVLDGLKSISEPVRVEVTDGHGQASLGTVTLSSVLPPLILRTTRTGDTIVRKGASTPVRTLVAENGVPERERDTVPVLEDRTGVRAVMVSRWGGACVTGDAVMDSITTKPLRTVSLDLETEVTRNE